MKGKKKVIVLSTGGTIEKVYDERDGTLANKASVIKEILFSKMKLPYKDIELKVILAKDSLNMTDEDRDLILHYVENEQKRDCPIVILHGTDTMENTAKHLFEKLKPSVPIILTGAMRPLVFEDTDARQNVIEAVMATSLVEPAVYISFHGELFKAPKVRKNHQTLTFEALE